MEKPFTLYASELRDFVLAQGVPDSAIKLRDPEYLLPTAHWVTDVFGPWFSAKLVAENYTYRPNSRDCDKFARKAAALAGDCNAVTEERAGNAVDEYSVSMRPTYGLALGEIKYVTRPHSINVALHRPEGQLILAVYEPQPTYTGLQIAKLSMRPLTFTRKDWESCTDFDI